MGNAVRKTSPRRKRISLKFQLLSHSNARRNQRCCNCWHRFYSIIISNRTFGYYYISDIQSPDAIVLEYFLPPGDVLSGNSSFPDVRSVFLQSNSPSPFVSWNPYATSAGSDYQQRCSILGDWGGSSDLRGSDIASVLLSGRGVSISTLLPIILVAESNNDSCVIIGLLNVVFQITRYFRSNRKCT